MKTKAPSILFPIDPFHKHPAFQKTLSQGLRLLKNYGYKIDPLFVLDFPHHLSLAAEKGAHKDIAKYAQKIAGQFLQSLKLSKMQVGIIEENRASIKEEVQDVLRYAKKSKPDFIFLPTHGRKGWERFVLGSFAETTLLMSSQPMLFVNPYVAKFHSFKNIFLPTNLGTHSFKELKAFLPLIKKFGARITIYHFLPPPQADVLGTNIYFPYLLKLENERISKHMNLLKKFSERYGVKADIIIDNGVGSKTDAILKHMKKCRSDLMMMPAPKGNRFTGLLGSVVRQVVRQAPCPVFVLPMK